MQGGQESTPTPAGRSSGAAANAGNANGRAQFSASSRSGLSIEEDADGRLVTPQSEMVVRRQPDNAADLTGGDPADRRPSRAQQARAGFTLGSSSRHYEGAEFDGQLAGAGIVDPDSDVAREMGRTGSKRSRTHTLAGFQPDCGLTVDTPSLSYAKARVVRAQRHALRLVDGVYHHLPFCQDFGHHPAPAPLNTCVKGNSPHDISKLGLSVLLYFRAVKMLSIVFFVLSLFAIVPIFFYWNGSQIDPGERALILDEAPLEALFFTTLGSLGEGTTLCEKTSIELNSAQLNQTVDVACTRGIITSIEAYYGNPKGECSCPAARQTDTSGQCPGSRQNADTCKTDEACFLGITQFDDPCCSNTTLSDGTGDNRDIDIAGNPNCNSDSAQFIAQGLCLGNQSCTLHLNPNHVHTWEVDDDLKTYCDASQNASERHCASTFGSGLTNASCPASERTLIISAECIKDEVTIVGTTYEKATVVEIAASLDLIMVLIFVFSGFWLIHVTKVQVRRFDTDSCSPSDYTVRIHDLPRVTLFKADPKLLAEELKAHLEMVLSGAPAITDEGPVEIADINFGLKNQELLKYKKLRGEAAMELERCEYELSVYTEKFGSTLSSAVYSTKKEAEIKVWRSKFHAMHEKVLRLQSGFYEPVTAFVTFRTEEGFLRCMDTYPRAGFVHRLCQSRSLRFADKRLNISRAKEPDDYNWENLALPLWQRWMRGLVVLAITGLILFCSFLMVKEAKQEEVKLELKYPERDCGPYTVVYEDPAANATEQDASILSPQDVVNDEMWEYLGLSEGNTGLLECFCKARGQDKGARSMLNFKFDNPKTGKSEKWCSDWATDYVFAQGLKYLVALVVVGINVSLKGFLKRLMKFSAPPTKSEAASELTAMLFLAQLINTSLVVLLINGNLKYFSDRQDNTARDARQEWDVMTGQYDDFSPDWYRGVGVPILLSVMMFIFVPHTIPLVQFIKKSVKQLWDRHCTCDHRLTRKVTQAALEKLYTGPPFSLEMRYAVIMTTIFVTMIYGAGMPMLFPVAAASLAFSYWLDKFLVLRFYRLPPMLDESLAIFFGRSLIYAAILHVMVAMWMFSFEGIVGEDEDNLAGVTISASENATDALLEFDVEDVFGGFISSSVNDRIFGGAEYLVLFFVVFLLLLCYVVWDVFLVGLLKRLSFLAAVCPCLACLFTDTPVVERNPDYFHAISTDRLRFGLEYATLKRSIEKQYRHELRRRQERGYEPPDRMIDGVESYDMQSNEEYIQTWALDSEHVIHVNRTALGRLSTKKFEEAEEATPTTYGRTGGALSGLLGDSAPLQASSPALTDATPARQPTLSAVREQAVEDIELVHGNESKGQLMSPSDRELHSREESL